MFKEYDIFSLQRVSSQFIGLVSSFLLLNLDSDFASENTELVIQNNQCHRFPLKGDSCDDNRYADEMRIPGIPPPALATRVYVDVLSFTRTTRMVVPNLASPA